MSKRELQRSMELVRDYQYGRIPEMNDELWRAKKSTSLEAPKANYQSSIQPFTPVELKFRLSNVQTRKSLSSYRGECLRLFW